MSILVHNCEAFNASVLRPLFRHINDLGIEIRHIAGEFLIHKISDLMRNTSQPLHIRTAATFSDIALCNNIPQHKFNLEQPIFDIGTANQQSFCAKRCPISKIGANGWGFWWTNKGSTINCHKQSRANQII